MPNTYKQIHIHAVFAVQNRKSLISKEWQERLYKYIIAIIHKHNHKVLAIGGVPDHIHILFGFRPTQALSNLIQMDASLRDADVHTHDLSTTERGIPNGMQTVKTFNATIIKYSSCNY